METSLTWTTRAKLYARYATGSLRTTFPRIWPGGSLWTCYHHIWPVPAIATVSDVFAGSYVWRSAWEQTCTGKKCPPDARPSHVQGLAPPKMNGGQLFAHGPPGHAHRRLPDAPLCQMSAFQIGESRVFSPSSSDTFHYHVRKSCIRQHEPWTSREGI